MEPVKLAWATLASSPGAALATQAGASLLAILIIYGLARWFGLGGDVRIRDEDHARDLADETLSGFAPVAIGLDRARIGALLRDATGRVLLIRRHGARFAGRLITSHAGIRLDRQFLTIATDDRHFGTITLDLGPQAQVWASSLRRLATAQ